METDIYCGTDSTADLMLNWSSALQGKENRSVGTLYYPNVLWICAFYMWMIHFSLSCLN